MELGDKWAAASTLIGLGRLAIASSGDRGKDGSNRQHGAQRGVRILRAVEALLENMGAKVESMERAVLGPSSFVLRPWSILPVPS
jgi:hypothetical protein